MPSGSPRAADDACGAGGARFDNERSRRARAAGKKFMDAVVDGESVFVATGNDRPAPAVLLLHGAGMDHTMWATQRAALMQAGRWVLALDMPGHGRSTGSALTSIQEAARWLLRLLNALEVDRAALVGFSMGALVALEAAARAPDRVPALTLAGVVARMWVHPKLLAAARVNSVEAFAMIGAWGHWRAEHAPATTALLARSKPGVLYADLKACDDYADAVDAAKKVRCPVLLLLAENDRMTPPAGADLLVKALHNVTRVVLPESGHMMMDEAAVDATAATTAFVLTTTSASAADAAPRGAKPEFSP